MQSVAKAGELSSCATLAVIASNAVWGLSMDVRCRKPVRQRGLAKRGDRKPDQDAWAKPQLALQGIAPQARVRLLACALAALEKQIEALPATLSM